MKNIKISNENTLKMIDDLKSKLKIFQTTKLFDYLLFEKLNELQEKKEEYLEEEDQEEYIQKSDDNDWSYLDN